MWVKIVDPVKGNNVKSLGNLVGYVSQIMFTQFAAEVYVIAQIWRTFSAHEQCWG